MGALPTELKVTEIVGPLESHEVLPNIVTIFYTHMPYFHQSVVFIIFASLLLFDMF